MNKCSNCEIKMGYSEAKSSRDYGGLCLSCYVKSLVKNQIENKQAPRQQTNIKSIDGLFKKFENITITTETSLQLRIKKRFGVVHGEAAFTNVTYNNKPMIYRIFNKTSPSNDYAKAFRRAVEDAEIELKANAIKLGANCIIGYNMQAFATTWNKQDHIAISVFGTAVEVT